tara:strand:+ start:599 stop:979 length:381 start_codon:yes stop_codon:yes gene_type:complete
MKKQKKILHSSKWGVKSSFPYIKTPKFYIWERGLNHVPQEEAIYKPTFEVERKRITFDKVSIKDLSITQLLKFQTTVNKLHPNNTEFKYYSKGYLLLIIEKEISNRDSFNAMLSTLTIATAKTLSK